MEREASGITPGVLAEASGGIMTPFMEVRGMSEGKSRVRFGMG